jgi:hypothetical protein
MPIACDVRRRPRRLVKLHALVCLRSCFFGEYAFHQLPGGRVIDRFRRGPLRDAERLQQGAEREVVVLSRAKRVKLNTTTKCTQFQRDELRSGVRTGPHLQ